MKTVRCLMLSRITCLLIPALFFALNSIHGQPDSISTETVSAAPDTIVLDTSDYVKGDIHFNLIVAAYKGYSEEVLRLLNMGAYVDYRSAEGASPLMYAVQNGHLLVAKILLLNGAEPDLKDGDMNSALITSVEFNDLEMAELLIRNDADINIRDSEGRTALMLTAAYGLNTIADMLLYYEANVNAVDYEGNTALNIAAFTGHTQILKLLAANKSSIEKADKSGFTPMHSAAQEGHVEIIEYLVAQGANKELQTRAGHTALSMAVMNKHVAVVEFLTANNAHVNAKITSGIRPMNIAKKVKNDSIIQILISNHAEKNRWPSFQYSAINFDFNASANDFFLGGGFGIHDTKYNLSASIGYAHRIPAKAILDEENANTYYQYWERRSIWYLGAEKRFQFARMAVDKAFGATLGGQLIYTHGNYRGSSTKPESGFRVSPQAGLYLRSKGAVFTLKYEYLNFKVEKVSPHRFNFGIGFLIPGKYVKNNTKKELWEN